MYIVDNSGKTPIAQPLSPNLNLKHDKTTNRQKERWMDTNDRKNKYRA
jgi:hypothetical protein